MAQGATLDEVETGIVASGEYYSQQQGVDLPIAGQSNPVTGTGQDNGGQLPTGQGNNGSTGTDFCSIRGQGRGASGQPGWTDHHGRSVNRRSEGSPSVV